MLSIKPFLKSFMHRRRNWAIGLYQGQSPVDLRPVEQVTNPVLTAKHVSDVPADFVADPFMVREGDRWYMFFEVFNAQTQRGCIGLATSADGLHWTYERIVLDEPFHLSYPYVFQHENEYYMIPECSEEKAVRLYRATHFPTAWSYEKELLAGADFVDPTLFYSNSCWWLFATTTRNNELQLYYADHLTGPWQVHPESPVIENNLAIARPAGRVVSHQGRLYRYAQDDTEVYGKEVRVFEITELTRQTYREEAASPQPILQAQGRGWNAVGMHNIDPHEVSPGQWLACVDGYYFGLAPGPRLRPILERFSPAQSSTVEPFAPSMPHAQSSPSD